MAPSEQTTMTWNTCQVPSPQEGDKCHAAQRGRQHRGCGKGYRRAEERNQMALEDRRLRQENREFEPASETV